MSWAGVSIAIGLGAVLAAIHPLLLVIPAAWVGWQLLKPPP